MSEESRKKLSNSKKGKPAWIKGKKYKDLGIVHGWTGKKHTEESKEKMRKAHLGKIGPWRDKNRSEDTKIKISKKLTGIKLPETTRLKMSESRKGNRNPNWKDGVSKELTHYQKARRARKMNASGAHSVSEWETLKAQYNWTCPSCKRFEPEIKLTEDHIIPLSKGGSNNIENIQPLCGSCNSKKRTKTIKF